jgi:carbamoylphosphate synthase small subunit
MQTWAKTSGKNYNFAYISHNFVYISGALDQSAARGGDMKIALIDYGVKQNIIRCLAQRRAEVHLVPHDFDVSRVQYDGIFISNGPGNPAYCTETVHNIRKLYKQNRHIF